ncbi:GtrA family protein [Devosia sp. A449]
MSAALQSLMREMPRRRPDPPGASDPVAFLAIGATSAIAFVLLSTLLIWLDSGLPNWVVNTLCYGGFVVPVYLLHRRFSFSTQASHRQALPRYVAVQAMALVLTALFAFIFHELLGLPTIVAATLVVGMTVSVNYVVLRRWAFAQPRLEEALA